MPERTKSTDDHHSCWEWMTRLSATMRQGVLLTRLRIRQRISLATRSAVFHVFSKTVAQASIASIILQHDETESSRPGSWATVGICDRPCKMSISITIKRCLCSSDVNWLVLFMRLVACEASMRVLLRLIIIQSQSISRKGAEKERLDEDQCNYLGIVRSSCSSQ